MTPSATRRAGQFVAAVVALGLLGACSGGSGGSSASPRNDAAATRALEHRFELGAAIPWLVRSAFRRKLADGRALRADVAELNRPPDTHLDLALGSLAGTLRGKAVDCSTSAGTPTCSPDSTANAPGSGAEAIRTVTDPRLGWYTVHRSGRRTVAGRRADCFLVAATSRAGQLDFGRRSDLCFLANGIPVRKVVVRSSGTDTTNATSIVQSVTDADVDGLVAPFRGG